MKKDFLFTNPGNNPFLRMGNSRRYVSREKMKNKICGSFKVMAVAKILFQAFLELKAVKLFHLKWKPENVSSLSNDCEIYIVLLTNSFLWKSISDFVCEYVLWESMWECSARPTFKIVCFPSNDYEIYLFLLMKTSDNVCRIKICSIFSVTRRSRSDSRHSLTHLLTYSLTKR